MLNEKLEFRSYTTTTGKPDSLYVECLKPSVLGEDFTGIRRPMLVIARHYIRKSLDNKKYEIEDSLLYAETALRLWVGERNALDKIYLPLADRIFNRFASNYQFEENNIESNADEISAAQAEIKKRETSNRNEVLQNGFKACIQEYVKLKLEDEQTNTTDTSDNINADIETAINRGIIESIISILKESKAYYENAEEIENCINKVYKPRNDSADETLALFKKLKDGLKTINNNLVNHKREDQINRLLDNFGSFKADLSELFNNNKAEVADIIDVGKGIGKSENYRDIKDWLPKYIRNLTENAIKNIKDNDSLNESQAVECNEICDNIINNINEPNNKRLSEYGLEEFVNELTKESKEKKWPKELPEKENDGINRQTINLLIDNLNKETEESKKESLKKDISEKLKNINIFNSLSVDEQIKKYEEIRKANKLIQNANTIFGVSKKLVKLTDKLSDLPGQYAHRTFTFNIYDSGDKKNDFNKITYEEILMDAYNMKEEARFYLFVDPNLEFEQSVTNNQSNDAKNHKDYILKIIATYLMKKNEAESFEDDMYVYCPKYEITNWCEKSFRKNEHCKPEVYMFGFKDKKCVVVNSNNSKNFGNDLAKDLAKGIESDKENDTVSKLKGIGYKPIIEICSGSSKQQSSFIKINSELLSFFQLVSESEFEEFNKNHSEWVFYSDPGFEKTLIEGKKYEDLDAESQSSNNKQGDN